ncbi:hypothetical protein OsI_24138 [Oryza sativa Indica Group]|uniref:Uncharacterized protein n=1 Tax=Oryza sativa subsp. indica TaxID=39946 RepID=B8B1E9_ORYSI|nr:hypothetical protein OsI_24138 [Oryza sativa Indica Group]
MCLHTPQPESRARQIILTPSSASGSAPVHLQFSIHTYDPSTMANPEVGKSIHGYLAVLFTSAAASVIIYAVAIDRPSAAQAFIGFVIFLLGASLALLASVAEQFPAAARIGVAVAVALRGYLFGAT